MITGYNMETGTDSPTDPNNRIYWAVAFECVSSDLQTSLSGVQHSLADVVASGKCNVPGAMLRASIALPNCWDGKYIDTADHRSHMAPQGRRIADRRFCDLPASLFEHRLETVAGLLVSAVKV
jgi:hypothetical protein